MHRLYLHGTRHRRCGTERDRYPEIRRSAPRSAASRRVSRSSKPICARRACSAAKRAATHCAACDSKAAWAVGSAASSTRSVSSARNPGCAGTGAPGSHAFASPSGVSFSQPLISDGSSLDESPAQRRSASIQRSQSPLRRFLGLKCPSSRAASSTFAIWSGHACHGAFSCARLRARSLRDAARVASGAAAAGNCDASASRLRNCACSAPGPGIHLATAAASAAPRGVMNVRQ